MATKRHKRCINLCLLCLFVAEDLPTGEEIVRLTVVLAAVAVLASTSSASTGPIPLNCNRACLENVVEQYLSALVARDPSRLPVSKYVKYNNNDQALDFGDAFWKTVKSRGHYAHILADPYL